MKAGVVDCSSAPELAAVCEEGPTTCRPALSCAELLRQEETQVRLPMPHGSIISEADAWAAAAGSLSDGEDQSPRPPPFVPDGLTVSFFPESDKTRPRRGRRRHERSDRLSDTGLKRPSKEHSGNFGRWGPEAREQWSCCLWDERGAAQSSAIGGEFSTTNTTNGGGKTRGRRSGAANGCEDVPPRPVPGGMTTADDVRLVWGASQYKNTSTCGSETPNVRHEAWGTGEGDDDRELWKPMLASRIRGGGGGSCGGAAWSLIRHHRRPQTANARLVGRGMTTTAAAAAAADGSNGDIPSGKGKTTAGFGAGNVCSGGGGGGGAVRHNIAGKSFRGGSLHGSSRSRPGSAPSPGTRTNRRPNHNHPDNHHHLTKRPQSSLVALRSARARAGWQRKRPLHVGRGKGNGNGVLRGNPTAGSGGTTARAGGGGVAGVPWHSRSLMSLHGGGSTYSVYSRGEGRAAAMAQVEDAAPRGSGKENSLSRRP